MTETTQLAELYREAGRVLNGRQRGREARMERLIAAGIPAGDRDRLVQWHARVGRDLAAEAGAWFRGDSIRVENGRCEDLPVFGRVAAVVEQVTPRVYDAGPEGDPELRWMWTTGGVTGGGYETAAEALAAAEAHLLAHGWTRDPRAAEAEARAVALARHHDHCRQSRSYRNKFGSPAYEVREL